MSTSNPNNALTNSEQVVGIFSDGKLPGDSETYAVLHQETPRLDRLVEDLRMLSLADAGELPMQRQAVAPASLMERAAARFHLTAQNKPIRFQTEIIPQLAPVNVDPQRLAHVLDNLLGNALRHNPNGERITLGGEPVAGGGVRLSVMDSRPGIPLDDLPFIFDCFYRGDHARHGSEASGLGLAIAHSIIEAHGGSLQVETTPSSGACFSMIVS